MLTDGRTKELADNRPPPEQSSGELKTGLHPYDVINTFPV